jgi:ATP-binding cassette subfamily C protein LapB
VIQIQDLFDRLVQSPSPQARLLPELLTALNWPGEAIQLRNAISGSPQTMDGVDLLNTLANLGYRWDVVGLPLDNPRRVAQRLDFPLLIRSDEAGSEFRVVPDLEGLRLPSGGGRGRILAYEFRFEPERAGEKRQWFQAQVLRFRGGISELYVISLLINLLALVMPLYIRAVYNLEIPGGQAGDLFLLLPFAVAAVLLQVWLTQRRQARLADLGAELDLLLSTRVLEKVLLLRLPQLERYTPLTLANRLRSYRGLRSYVTGPVALAALDLPFIGIFLVAIAAMSIPLMLLTVLMVLVCFGGVYLVGMAGRAVQQPLARNSSNLEPLLLDVLQNFTQIKRSGGERRIYDRLQQASSDSVVQGLAPMRLQQLLAILTSEFSQLTGALILATGAGIAIAGNSGIELGTLIATMFFVWRVFKPIQTAYQALSRWSQMQPSLVQLNRLMGATDVEPSTSLSSRWVLPQPKGAIAFKNVNLRLNALQEPTLTQLNLKVEPGQLLVLSGPEGSGTSSLLRLIDAQIAPGSGVITLDGHDIRQYPLGQVRQAVGYLPEDGGVFPGTLRENLLLAGPFLSDADLEARLLSLGLDELLEGPGLDRLVTLQGPHALLPNQVQGVALARMLLAEPVILLLDQPFLALEPHNVRALIEVLRQRKGSGTTLVVSDRPELLEIADQIAILRDGALVFAGTPEELIAAQQKAASPPRQVA